MSLLLLFTNGSTAIPGTAGLIARVAIRDQLTAVVAAAPRLTAATAVTPVLAATVTVYPA